jgi:hypothetical protein
MIKPLKDIKDVKREIFIDPIGKVVFYKGNEVTIPIGINYNHEEGTYESIENIDYYKIFIDYVFRSRQSYDPIKKKMRYRELFPYQWSTCLIVIDSVINGKGKAILPLFSRQTGKSEAIKVYLPFLTVFGRRYLDIIHERFSSILGSYKDDTIEKLRKEVLPYFKIALQVHNELFPDTKLVAKFDKQHNNLINNSNRLEIALLHNGAYLPYSECFFITLGASQDSLTSHLTVIDESGKCNLDLFDNSIAPFSISTGGSQVFIGVPSTDPNSLLQAKYNLDNSDKYIYDWRIIYSLTKKVNPRQAEVQRTKALEEMSKSGGIKSATNRMNYYLEFIMAEGLFLSKDIIEQHNMFSIEDNDMSISFIDREKKFRVAGIDISATSTGDYFAMSRGIAWQDDFTGLYKSEVKRITVLNKNNELLNISQKVNIVCDMLINEQIDICIVDSTSQQLHFIQRLVEVMRLRGIKTLLIPFAYTKKSKQVMFSNWEESLYSGFLKFPLKNTSWETERLYKEMTTLLKEESKDGSISYYAYKSKNDIESKNNTDDLCNSTAMLHYALQYLDNCIANNKWFEDGSGNWWRPERRHVNRLGNISSISNERKSNKLKINLAGMS